MATAVSHPTPERNNRLSIYRRHTTTCIKGYEQNFKITHPQTPKEWKADCECPIVAEGYLRNHGGRIRHQSLGKVDWDDAEALKAKFEGWGQLTNPDPNPTLTLAPTLATGKREPTISEAYEIFVDNHTSKNAASTLQDFKQFHQHRLAPFYTEHKLNSVRVFEDHDVVSAFLKSWVNAKTGKPLADGTKRAELERFRAFLTFCEERGWISKNTAKAKSHSIRLGKVAKKFGLNPHEEAWCFEAIELLVDCYGRRGQRNAQETEAFLLVLRNAGLRIGDATNLDETQLVPGVTQGSWVIEIVYPEKTDEYVRIPITRETADALHALPFKGRDKYGKGYWFRTGKGSWKTAKTIWRKRITKLLEVAQQKDKNGVFQRPFAKPASPHSLRHTFAISHLNQGTPIKFVSDWLGHKSQKVTEGHYSHANRATNVASEREYAKSMKKQEAAKRKDNGKKGNVVPIRKRA